VPRGCGGEEKYIVYEVIQRSLKRCWGESAGGNYWQRVEDSWPERERTFGDGRFRNGKWEEQDLSDREMRFGGG
jgi:hypothetical protein